MTEFNNIPLSVRELGYSYPDGTVALRNVSFDLAPGERLALVGPNGCGKSTLMLHLAGCIAPMKGEVRLSGQVVGGNLKKLRKAAGLIFQNPDDQLFMPLVREDVAFGPRAAGCPLTEAAELAEKVLDVLGIADLADRPPHRLSGGQKRLVSLAGILAMRPEIMLLDEPTNALDPRARRLIIERLASLPQSMLIATHDLDMVLDLCPRVIVMNHGEIVASGETARLLRDESFLRRSGLELPLRFS